MWLGTALLIIGIIINIGASIQHVRLMKRLHRGEALEGYSGPALAVAFILAALGLAMVVNLSWLTR
jgi:hypothetical protein